MSAPAPARGLGTMSPALPDAVNYRRWLLDLIRPHLGGDVLEVGFGHGQYTAALARSARSVVAVDSSPDCLQSAQGLPANVETRLADLAAPSFVRDVGPARFDVAVCLNVLEHLADDAAALRSMAQTLRPGGTLFLFVPAHPALYGPLDALAGHFRRYQAADLGALLRSAGYADVSVNHFNPLGGLGWWLSARLTRPRALADPSVGRQVLWFDRYVQPLSRLVDPLTRGFFGQSLWAVARRPVAPPTPV